MDSKLINDLIQYLSDFISEERIERIEQILANRTNHLTIVLEDLHKSHNANAVLRSAEAFGIQDVHIIENKNPFDTADTVSIGSHKWLTLRRYNNPEIDNIIDCVKSLKSNGYQVLATTPHEYDNAIEDVDISKKTALVFGTELEGVSDELLELADGYVKIPMYGFSESFNISVSAAICMYELNKKLRTSSVGWQLNSAYSNQLKFEWIKQTIKAGDMLVQKYLENLDSNK